MNMFKTSSYALHVEILYYSAEVEVRRRVVFMELAQNNRDI